jgi:NADPH-dependent curcumin reductase CurA
MNKEILLASRPAGRPSLDNFRVVETGVPQPQDGELLLQTRFMSVDPYMRGRMRDQRSYAPPFALNEVIVGGGVAEVVESRAAEFQPGDMVMGMLPWRLFSVAPAKQLRKLDPNSAPVTTALGVLGMPGLTAYFGLLDIGQPREGETVLVSGAAGAVGMTVCQIARIKGCRVVGIAGSEEKLHYLENELGVDATINYKTADIKPLLRAACPNGVDVYFDNVGGEISDAVLQLIKHSARIIICGQISLYNLERPDTGPRPQPYLLVNSARMQGFIVSDYAARFAEGGKQLAEWLAEGKLKYLETFVDGFENAPRAFMDLFDGKNLGEQLVRV